LRSNDQAAPRKQLTPRTPVLEVNALNTNQYKQRQSSSGAGSDLYEDSLKKKSICFHCGNRGHTLTECRIYANKSPQTPAGQQAFAQFQQLRGTNYAYDPLALLASAKRRKDKYAQTQSGSTASNALPPSAAASSSSPAARSSGSGGSGKGRLRKRIPDEEAEDVDSNSLEVIDTWKEGDDDDAEDKDDEQTVTVSSINMNTNNNERGVKTYTSLCVSVSLNNLQVGYGLVDQGANRMLLRREAIAKFGLSAVIRLCPVTNYSVSSAMGQRLPISARFVAQMALNGIEFNNEAVIYVVDAIPGGDLNCDLIIGRHTIATSKFRMIDTLRGRLCAPRTKEYIQCHPVVPYVDEQGKRCIRSDSHTVEDEEQVKLVNGVEVMSIAVTVEEKPPHKAVKRRPTRRGATAVTDTCNQ
jgi:hypothetical protein